MCAESCAGGAARGGIMLMRRLAGRLAARVMVIRRESREHSICLIHRNCLSMPQQKCDY